MTDQTYPIETTEPTTMLIISTKDELIPHSISLFNRLAQENNIVDVILVKFAMEHPRPRIPEFHNEIETFETIEVPYDSSILEIISSVLDYVNQDAKLEIRKVNGLTGMLSTKKNGIYNNPLSIQEWKNILNSYTTRNKSTFFKSMNFDRWAMMYLNKITPGQDNG